MLPWPGGGGGGSGGSGMEAWPEGAELLAKSGAVLGVALFCKIPLFSLFFTAVSHCCGYGGPH